MPPILLTRPRPTTGDAGLDALLDQAGAAERAAQQLGGPSASAPVAQLGPLAAATPSPEDTAAFIAGLVGEPDQVPPALARTPAPVAPAPAPAPAPRRRGVLGTIRTDRREAHAAPGADVAPEVAGDATRFFTESTPAQRADQARLRQVTPLLDSLGEAGEEEVFVDAQGNPVGSTTVSGEELARRFVEGVQQAPPSIERQLDPEAAAAFRSFVRPGGEPQQARAQRRGGGRARGQDQPPAPPTEEDLNAALVDALTARPDGDGPLFPEDFRGASPLEQQQQLLADRESFEREQADRQAILAADTMDREAMLEEQRAQIAERRQAALAAGRRRYEQALQRVAEQRIEPERFFRSRGVLGQVGAAIAMAVGTFAEAATGAPNRAMQIIDSAVQRDLEAQRMNLQNARQSAEAQRGVLQLMRSEFDDENAALDAARAAMLREAARRAEIEAAQARDRDAQLRAQELRTQLEQQARAAQESAAMREALAQLEFRRNVASTVQAEGEARSALATAARDERRAQARPGPGRVTDAKLDIYDRLVARGMDTERAARLAGLPGGVPPGAGAGEGEVDPAALERFGQRMQPLADADVTLRQLEDAVEGTDDIAGVGPVAGRLPGFMVGEEGRTTRRRALQVVLAISRAQGGADVTEQQAEQILDSIGLDPSATEDQWRNGLRELRRRHAAAVQSTQAGFGGPRSATVRAFERAGGFSGLASDQVRGVTTLRRAD